MRICPTYLEPWTWLPDNADDCSGPGGDVAFSGGDLAAGDQLRSIVMMQLLTDARDNGERGWWGNYAMPFPIGSRLWTLRQRPRNAETLIDAERLANEALAYLVTQGLAASFEVSAEFSGKVMNITVTLFSETGSVLATTQAQVI